MTRRLTASEYTELRAALVVRGADLLDVKNGNPDRLAEFKATTDFLLRSLDRMRLENHQGDPR